MIWFQKTTNKILLSVMLLIIKKSFMKNFKLMQKIWEKNLVFQKETPDQKKQKARNKVVQLKMSGNIQGNDMKVKINKTIAKCIKEKTNNIQLAIESPFKNLQKAKSVLLSFQQSTVKQLQQKGQPRVQVLNTLGKDMGLSISLDEENQEEGNDNNKQVDGTLIIRQNFELLNLQISEKKTEEQIELEQDLDFMKKLEKYIKKKQEGQNLEHKLQITEKNDFKIEINGKITKFSEIAKKFSITKTDDSFFELYDPNQTRHDGNLELAQFRTRNYEKFDLQESMDQVRKLKAKTQIDKKKFLQSKRPTAEEKKQEKMLSQNFKKQKVFKNIKPIVQNNNIKDTSDKKQMLKYFDPENKIVQEMKRYFINNNIDLNDENIINYINLKTSKSVEELRSFEQSQYEIEN